MVEAALARRPVWQRAAIGSALVGTAFALTFAFLQRRTSTAVVSWCGGVGVGLVVAVHVTAASLGVFSEEEPPSGRIDRRHLVSRIRAIEARLLLVVGLVVFALPRS